MNLLETEFSLFHFVDWKMMQRRQHKWFGSASVIWFRNEQHHQHDRKRELSIINAKLSTFIHIRQTQNDSYQVIVQRSLQEKNWQKRIQKLRTPVVHMHFKAQQANGKIIILSDIKLCVSTNMIQPGSASVFWFRNEQHHQHDRKRELSIINATMSTFIHIQQTQNDELSSNCATLTARKKLTNTHSKTQNACGTHAFQSSTSKREDHYTFWYQAVSAPTWFNLAQQVFFDSGTSSIINMIGRGSSQSSTPNCPHSSTFNKHKMTSYQVIAQRSLKTNLQKHFQKLRTPVVHMHGKAQQASRKVMAFWNQSVSAPTWFNLAQQVLFDSGTSSIINMIGRGSSQSSTPNCPHSSTFNKHKMTSYQVIAQRSLKTNLQKHFQKLRTPVVHMHGKAQQASRKVMTFSNQSVSAPTWFNLAQQVLFDSGTSSIINMIGRGSSQSSTPKCAHSTSTKWQCNIPATLRSSFSDQTNAIPHWLWNQPPAPPVHPEDGVKGCLGNAVKVSEPQKMSSCHSQINLPGHYPLNEKSKMLGHKPLGWMFTVSTWSTKHHEIAKWYTLLTSRCKTRTRLCNSFRDQTTAIPHWLWNQPSAPPVHPEDGVKGCLGNAVKVSEPQKMSSCHSHINLPRHYPVKKNEKSKMLGHLTFGLMVHCFYMINKTSCNCKMIHTTYQ